MNDKSPSMKPQIYKVGPIWIVWVPGVRVYRFTSWQSALNHVLENRASSLLESNVKPSSELSMGAAV